MKRLMLCGAVLLCYMPNWIQAQDVSFVENADEMVEQMLGGGNGFGQTRGFVVVEPETKPIQVLVKNNQGRESTVVVQVPKSGIDTAARLKVEFDVNSATLRSSAYPLLDELSKALRDERIVEHNVCIKGHTDSDGDASYNLELSYARATSVLCYLRSTSNIDADRLQVFGYGEFMPLVTNDNWSNKQLNRRVEVSLNCPKIH